MRSNSSESEYRKVLSDCFNGYKEHLHVSSKDEALAVISGDGSSFFEIACMWMGRWRPTSAVVLVYSTMGLDQVGAAKVCNRNAVWGENLNEQQLSGLGALQELAYKVESDISKELAGLQMLLVEQNVVRAVLVGESKSDEPKGMPDFDKQMDARLGELQRLLGKADELRLHTLRELLDLLTPSQGASCLVAAFELVFSLRSLSRLF